MPKISHESDISYQIKLLYAVYTLYTLYDVFVEKNIYDKLQSFP